MGSGKTTFGKKMASKLNVLSFDLDSQIEKKIGNSISDIFKNNGEAYFRQLESEVLNEIISNNKNFVMSLGGGTPCFNNNMELIKSAGTSVYLKYNAGMLTSRLINAKDERPLIQNLNETELKDYVNTKLVEREKFYNQSNFIAEGNNLKVDDLLLLIQ